MKKITGHDFKKFYNDEDFWGEDAYCDDATFAVNTIPFDDRKDLINELQNGDIVSIKSGIVMNSKSASDGSSLQSFYNKWYKQQTTATIVIEVKKESLEKSIKDLQQLGYKII